MKYLVQSDKDVGTVESRVQNCVGYMYFVQRNTAVYNGKSRVTE